MRKLGSKVPPRSKKDIYRIASDIRSVFNLNGPYVFIENIYEALPELMEGFNFEIVGSEEIDNDEGRTEPNSRLIQIREDVYDGACKGIGRHRFTMAHELGHLFLHPNVQFCRFEPNELPKLYLDSEWQADTFASGFLVNEDHLRLCGSIEEVSTTFGISYSAAKCRFGR